MNQDETNSPTIADHLENLLEYIEKNPLQTSIATLTITILGVALLTFNGWDFIKAQPIQQYKLPSTPTIIGTIITLIGAISTYAVNANRLNLNKIPKGTTITIIGIILLIPCIYIGTQTSGWNYPAHAPLGTIHPLITKLAFPTMILSLLSLTIGLVTVGIDIKKKKEIDFAIKARDLS